MSCVFAVFFLRNIAIVYCVYMYMYNHKINVMCRGVNFLHVCAGLLRAYFARDIDAAACFATFAHAQC